MALSLLANTTVRADFSTDFNANAETLNDNFTRYPTTSDIFYGATVGVDGSGGVTSSGNRTLVQNTAFTSLVAGNTITQSIFLKSGNTAVAFGQTAGAFGLSNVNANLTDALATTVAGDGATFGIGFQSVSTATNLNLYRWRSTSSVSVGGVVTSTSTITTDTDAAAFTLLTNNWYKLDLTYTLSDTAGTWNTSAILTDFGTNGTVQGSVLSSVNLVLSSAGASTLYSSANVFGAFNVRAIALGGGSANHFDGFDNYAVAVPEPSTYALGMFGLLVCLIVAHRRKATSA